MKTVSLQIAEALDAAMENYYGPGKRISGAELGRLSGVPQPTVSRTLKGKSTPETETLAKLVSVLGSKNVNLSATINALLPPQELQHVDILDKQIFPLICPTCGKVSHKSFIQLEMNDRLPCGVCGDIFNINSQYGNGELKVFLEALGYSGFILRENRKFD